MNITVKFAFLIFSFSISHSKRCNLLIYLRVVQPNQHILGKNDEYEICRKFPELFKYVKRGGKKGGQGVPRCA